MLSFRSLFTANACEYAGSTSPNFLPERRPNGLRFLWTATWLDAPTQRRPKAGFLSRTASEMSAEHLLRHDR